MPEMQNGELILDGYIADDQDAAYFPDPSAVITPGAVRRLLSQTSGDVVVWLNSAGGDPIAGEAIRAMLVSHAGRVTVRVAGMAASAASLLAMAGDRIEMSRGSLIMIHDPSTCVCGRAEDLRQGADRMENMTRVYAEVYARRSGQSVEAVQAMMRVETWMGSDEAIAQGFADAVLALDDLPDPPALMQAHLAARMTQDGGQRAFRQTLEMLAQVAPQTAGSPPASPADPAMTQEGIMPQTPTQAAGDNAQPTPAAQATPSSGPSQQTPSMRGAPPAPAAQPDADAIRREERARMQAIRTAARPHMQSGLLDDAFVDGLIDEGLTLEQASVRMLSRLGTCDVAVSSRRAANEVSVGREDRETRMEGLISALSARITGAEPEDDRARPYMEMSLHEMAAASMGRPAPGMGSYSARERVLMQAMHTGSDFPFILSTSVNRLIESAYDTVERTFAAISREMTFSDFRPHDVVRPDAFPTLKKVNDTGEIKFGTVGEDKETLTLASYAIGLSISRQTLVNDDLGAIQEVIDNAAMIVPEFEEVTWWTTFLANGALRDGTAMFHADHGNLASSGAAPSVTTLATGRKAMRKQVTKDGRPLVSNAPAFLVAGPEWQTEIEQLMVAIAAAKPTDVNPFSGKLTPIFTEQITDKQWFLLVDPSRRSHNMRHGYLRDRAAPRVRVEEPFGVQGTRMTLEHDFGVGGVNHRGGWKNPGQ
jgi:ATP-dependent protease ClpP protease subunit